MQCATKSFDYSMHLCIIRRDAFDCQSLVKFKFVHIICTPYSAILSRARKTNIKAWIYKYIGWSAAQWLARYRQPLLKSWSHLCWQSLRTVCVSTDTAKHVDWTATGCCVGLYWLLLLFIEYATSAGHHKKTYTHRNEKKDIKHSGKKHTHVKTIKSKV